MTTKTKRTTKADDRPPSIITMGCPRSIGPEICLRATASQKTGPSVIVGNRKILESAAAALCWPRSQVEKIRPFRPSDGTFRGTRLLEVGPALSASRRSFGKPDSAAGEAQLAYVEEGYRLAKETGWPLVTAAVSKEAIAKSGLKRASGFRGHTEWLEAMDDAPHSVMCFASPRLTTSLVTTHIPIRQLPRKLSEPLIVKATLELVDLLLRMGKKKPKIAICSLNPHGGEGKLLGKEEAEVIIPAVGAAQKLLGRKAQLEGAVGAETAYRKAAAEHYDGVVAMYHDQATIPMKLLDFGKAVNVTQGLSVVRTSVDHGTAYDIAGKGAADPSALVEAILFASKLAQSRRHIPHGGW